MKVILDGIKEAIRLIFNFDHEIMEVIFLSLKVSFISLLIASLIAIPLGIIIAKHQFRFKSILMRLIYTFMGFPPVLCGLFVFLLLMRNGPLGSLQLNFTVPAMIIAQVLLIIPIIMGLTISACKNRYSEVEMLAKTLGANKFETFKLTLFELKSGLLMAIVSGFSRSISEVGAVMLVGGNISGETRVMTTYISQLKSMGDYERAIAVGIILLIISFIANSILYHFQIKEGK